MNIGERGIPCAQITFKYEDSRRKNQEILRTSEVRSAAADNGPKIAACQPKEELVALS